MVVKMDVKRALATTATASIVLAYLITNASHMVMVITASLSSNSNSQKNITLPLS